MSPVNPPARYLYSRPAVPDRLIELDPGGLIGLGATPAEAYWEFRDNRLVLLCSDDETETCRLTWNGTAWTGNWLIYDRGEVHLSPLPEKAPANASDNP